MKINIYLKSSLRMGRNLAFLMALIFSSALSLQAQSLVWEENFDGTTINPDNWMFDFGDGCERGLCGWGNQELQYYTSRPENARIEDGNLLIEARRETFQSKQFTSARLRTYGRVHFKYGTLEAKIKVPDLKNGLWPAFWLLGTTGQWPASGEIDIMEMGSEAAMKAGTTNRQVGAAVHWAYQQWQADYDKQYISDKDLVDDYHIYKMTWDKEFIRVFIDGEQFFEFDIRGIEENSLEEFHKPQYILLNMAVGGQYTGLYGPGDITAPLPGKMMVDYIRLYQNPGDELYLGSDNEVSGNFGIYTENPEITNRLVYGQDAELYVWNNLENISPAPAPFEGNETLGFRAAPGNWFGFGVATNGPRNFSNYAEGSLKFNFKTSYQGQFKIGVSSGFGDSWINFAPGQSGYGLVRDGQWHEVTIPFSAFNQPNLGMHIDLGSIAQAFMMAGDPPGGNAEFFIDNVYYSGGVSSNPAPTVSITSPSSNQIFNLFENVTITANAADANGSVAKVEFYNGNTLLGADTSAPYSFVWESPAKGSYTITAKATDNEGASKTSLPVTIFIQDPNNVSPTVSITSPADNSTFYAPATIVINAEATDGDGSIYQVSFYNGGTLLSTDKEAPYSFNWNVSEPGTYKILAVAQDNESAYSASDTITIIVTEGVKPTVSITSPTNNSTFEAPASINIQASAETTEGSITKVEFYNGGALLATDITAPYSFNWLVENGGEYSLLAVAYNSVNGIGFSDTVNITVTENPGPNLALNKPAVSSSDENGTTIAGNAVDGNLTTRWSSAFADPQWIYVDLEAAFNINRVKISWEGALGRDYKVQVSDDAVNWADLKAVVGNNALVNDHKGLSGSGRYIRIYGTVRGTVYGYSIYELEVYGTPVPTWCGTIANGDYSYNAETADGKVTFTFHPEAPISGSNMAIVYIREGEVGAYPGYGMTKTESGDFTYTKSIADGTNVSFYFTYAVPSGGERNSSATPHSYKVGSTCGGVSNIPPTVSITSPLSTDSLAAPADIVITADASDSDGTIAKVEFYNGATLLGTDETAPYSYTWSGVSAGSYSLTAKATDNEGLSATSSAVNITVQGDGSNTGYCGTAENGDYSFKAETVGSNVTFTFHPEAPISGSNFALIYIREGSSGGYPGYLMTQNGTDFTFTKSIPAGTEVSIYFTYRISENGPERNSAANPHSYTVGTNCTTVNNPDADGDGFTADVDCDDTNASIYPGAPELCDGIDNNCDGQVDEGVTTTFYADADGDGFGNASDSIQACSAPNGYVTKAGDCNDNDKSINPDASDLCDGKDRNCDGKVNLPVQPSAISVKPSSNVNTGGDAKTIYLGYGSQSVTLTATNSASVSYTWSPAKGLSKVTGATTVFTPTAAGTYSIKVTATNAENCSSEATAVITVIDVRCGKDKVAMCFQGKSTCVSTSAVKYLLALGYKFGKCSDTGGGNHQLSVFPNPTAGDLNIETEMDMTDAKVKIYNLFGFEMRNVKQISPKKLDVSCLPCGSYVLVITKGKDKLHTSFMKK